MEEHVSFTTEGCDLGDGKSCSRLGGQYDKGDGVAKSAVKALELEERGCAKGWGNACWLAGSTLVLPQDHQDLAKARDFFAKGCALEHADSCRDQQEIDDGKAIVVAEIEDIVASPAKFVGKHVYMKNVAVRRASPTSGVVLKPGGSPALDGISSIVADDQDETRKKWARLPTPVKGVKVKFVEAMVEKQMARDARVRFVVIDVGDAVQ